MEKFGCKRRVFMGMAVRTESKVIVSIAFAVVGFFTFPTLIVCYGFSSEITMPINEATSGGLFQLPLQYFSFGFTSLCTEIIQSSESKSGIFWSFIICISITVIGTIVGALMKPPPRERNETLRNEASKSLEINHIDEVEYCEKGDTNNSDD